ncbi:MAG TPA: hypothetical protein V6D03_12015, partial [Candidatus Caenarcaniphilales bacterium]
MATTVDRNSQRSTAPKRPASHTGKWLKDLVPTAVALGIFLVLWQLFTMMPEANLPGPITTVAETWNYIVNPFFDNGGTDKG